MKESTHAVDSEKRIIFEETEENVIEVEIEKLSNSREILADYEEREQELIINEGL